jgi:hypothetical protein
MITFEYALKEQTMLNNQVYTGPHNTNILLQGKAPHSITKH